MLNSASASTGKSVAGAPVTPPWLNEGWLRKESLLSTPSIRKMLAFSRWPLTVNEPSEPRGERRARRERSQAAVIATVDRQRLHLFVIDDLGQRAAVRPHERRFRADIHRRLRDLRRERDIHARLRADIHLD